MSALAPVTFEVAGLACRIECAHAKPMAWVTDLHPGFRTDRPADVAVVFRYDDGYWARELPWVGADDVLDVPVCEASVDRTTIRGSYYDLELDLARRHAVVDLAMGFRVGGILRALYAALLPSRGACLVRATVRHDGDGAVLLADDDADDVVALAEHDGHIAVEATPFHGGTSPTRSAPRRLVGVDAGAASMTRSDVAAKLLERLVIVDHSDHSIERALTVLTRAAHAAMPLGAVGSSCAVD